LGPLSKGQYQGLFGKRGRWLLLENFKEKSKNFPAKYFGSAPALGLNPFLPLAKTRIAKQRVYIN